jgi:hypothetical protein
LETLTILPVDYTARQRIRTKVLHYFSDLNLIESRNWQTVSGLIVNPWG